MVTRKRKKNTRQHGGTTHGWGARKKHRGSGNRGGVGNAGSGKRAQSKKPSFWKDELYFGMHGFKKKGQKIDYTCINISDLKKYADKVGRTELNLADFGFNKLLGGGKMDKPYSITVEYASANAMEKINEAKGKITVLKPSSEDKAKNTKADD